MRASASPVYYGWFVLAASCELLVMGFAIIATRFIGFVYDQTRGYVPGFATFLAISSAVLIFTLCVGSKATKPAHA